MRADAEWPAARALCKARTSSSSSRTVVEIRRAIHSPYMRPMPKRNQSARRFLATPLVRQDRRRAGPAVRRTYPLSGARSASAGAWSWVRVGLESPVNHLSRRFLHSDAPRRAVLRLMQLLGERDMGFFDIRALKRVEMPICVEIAMSPGIPASFQVQLRNEPNCRQIQMPVLYHAFADVEPRHVGSPGRPKVIHQAGDSSCAALTVFVFVYEIQVLAESEVPQPL